MDFKGFLITNYKIEEFHPIEILIADYYIYHNGFDRFGNSLDVIQDENYYLITQGIFFDNELSKIFNNLTKQPENISYYLNSIDGEFSLALIDKNKKNILVVRDKIGHSEIFLKSLSGKINIFSDIRTLKILKPNRLSQEGVSQIFKIASYPIPPLTFFRDVYSLPAGCTWEINNNTEIPQHTNYWNYYDKKYEIKDENDISELVGEKLINSVKNRLNKNSENKIFYSGGLDSSSVLFSMLKITKEILPIFLIFTGVEAHEKFYQPVISLMKEYKLNLETYRINWEEDKYWDSILSGLDETLSLQAGQPLFLNCLKSLFPEGGKGQNFFWGESSDGLFGLNLTFEDDIDKIFGININKKRLEKFYRGKLKKIIY